MGNELRHRITVGVACLCCFAAALSATLAAAGANRWTAIGPDGANVVALVIDPHTPTTAFAGTLGSGILKTVDGGTTWATANAGLADKNILALVIDPSTTTTLYAGTEAGVFKTTDGGLRWVATSVGLVDKFVNVLAIDPGSPAIVYAGTAGGIFKSTDGAATWTSINTGLAGLTPRVIATDPISPSIIYVGVEDNVDYFRNGVFKSTDGGAAWARIYTTPTPFMGDSQYSVAAIVIDPRSSRLYMLLAYGDLLGSVDGGLSWSNVNEPQASLSSLAIDPAAPATLYAGSYSGAVFRTTDAGDHWAPVPGSPLAPQDITIAAFALAASAPGTVYVGSLNGIYRSLDSAQTWVHLTLGRGIGVNAFAVHPTATSVIYAAAANYVITKTTDGGIHWTDSTRGSVSAILIDPVLPSTVYAAGGDLLKSADAGRAWAPLAVHPYVSAIALAPSQHSTLYVGTLGPQVLKSVDGGFSWVQASSGITAAFTDDLFDATALAVDPSNADIVYVATQAYPNAKIYKSTDGATHWRQVPIALPLGTATTFIVIDPVTPSTIYAAYNKCRLCSGVESIGGIFKSVDSGETWTGPQVLPPATWVFALAIDPHTPSQIYAATLGGVYRSTDGAASWAPFNAGLPSPLVYGLSIDRTGSLLRAATDAGLFEYRVSGPPVAATAPLVEYVHAGFGHYFITSRPDEITKLDNGTFVGWSRTGSEFNAFAAPNPNSAPVCRFFSTAFAPKSSHFYTPFAAECATRRADPHWLLESADAFDIAVPAADGSCAASFAPVYRLYNNGQGGAPNHRYTTDLIVRAQMIAQGWMPEGLGPDAVQMCSPP